MATPVVTLLRELQGARSQNEFAKYLGVDKSFLSRVMSGDRSADSIIVRLLERFPDHAAEIAAAARETARPTEAVEVPA